MYLDEERVIDFCEYVAFGHDTLRLLLFLDVFLLHGFESVELSGGVLAGQDDFGIGALADD
jgi:hypothetical protein